MNINSIIIKSIIDSLNAEEQRLLDEWLKAKSNKRMYDNIRSHFMIRTAICLTLLTKMLTRLGLRLSSVQVQKESRANG